MSRALRNRVKQLEGSATLTPRLRASNLSDLSAIRNRCRMILEVTEDDALAEDLRGVIAAIDEGRYPAPATIPVDYDARAKAFRARMMATFD